MFDVNRLVDVVHAAIREFAVAHADETFYAFAVDANLLCLNSEEDFAKTLARYLSDWPDRYTDQNEIEELKYSTGDWKYQGFFDLDEEHGFDGKAYSDHYHEAGASQDGTAAHTEYAKAMTGLIERLKRSDAFAPLKRTDDFRISWVDHTY